MQIDDGKRVVIDRFGKKRYAVTVGSSRALMVIGNIYVSICYTIEKDTSSYLSISLI